MSAPQKPFDLTRVPGALWLEALTVGLARQARIEWFGTPMHLAALNYPAVEGLAAYPRDFRPASKRDGRDVLGGRFELAGDALALGVDGDPWDRASPTRRFAVALHRFDWLPALLTQDEAGAIEAIRLITGWNDVFGRWNPFAWSGEVLDRRTFNLACAAGALARRGEGPEDAQGLAVMLAKHARQLLQTAEPRGRRAQRLAAAAIAAAALSGQAGARLLSGALKRLERALVRDVL
ncbi:MAG: heparinase, partial [Caulobacteraceae bacterium]